MTTDTTPDTPKLTLVPKVNNGKGPQSRPIRLKPVLKLVNDNYIAIGEWGSLRILAEFAENYIPLPQQEEHTDLEIAAVRFLYLFDRLDSFKAPASTEIDRRRLDNHKNNFIKQLEVNGLV